MEWQLLIFGPMAVVRFTASAPSGPAIMRLEIRIMCTIEFQEDTHEDEGFIPELNTKIMRI